VYVIYNKTKNVKYKTYIYKIYIYIYICINFIHEIIFKRKQ